MLTRWASSEVPPRLTKKTSVLVDADPDEVKASLTKAREYGVQIMLEPNSLAALLFSGWVIGRVSQRRARTRT